MTDSISLIDEASVSSVIATVLLVDDDQGNRQLFGWILREAGYRVLEAGTGDEALELAQRSPDIVVLDVNLPDISGFEVCKRLRQLPATRHAGVIHLSAVYVESSDRMQGLDNGADAYLIKPIEPRELLAHLRAVLRARAAEAAHRRAAGEWRATFDAIQDAVCIVDLQGRIRRCNQALCRWLGQDFASLIDQGLDACLHLGLHLDYDPAVAALGRRKTRSISEWNLGQRWYEVTADPLRDDDGTLVGGVLILTDITRRRELEEQLSQAKRHEVIGKLAGGVAHDFNNLLTSIVGNASLLLETFPDDGPEHEQLSAIERAAWRGADLTRQLLGFARQTLLRLRLVDPATILAEAHQHIRHLLTEHIRLDLEVAPDLWAVQADSSQLSHIVIQLALDAIQAIQGKGRLLLQAANVEIDAEEERRHTDAKVGLFVRLSVQDDGPVIAPEIIANIFDPFAGAQPVARASGMGLAMVQGIVKQHQGWAECVSSVRGGTCFHLYLPRARSSVLVATTTHATAAFPTGSHVILLVDDDMPLRNLAGAYLSRAGFEVLLAGDDHGALATYRVEHSRITLILLDETMKDSELSKELARIHPDTTVAFIVGEDQAAPGSITKPYRERELIEAVHAVLSTR